MTRFCRDVLTTPDMDEFAHGPSRTPPPPSAYRGGDTPNTAAFVAALASGLVSGLAMMHIMRGGFSRFFTSSSSEATATEGDVQFSAVPDREIT